MKKTLKMKFSYGILLIGMVLFAASCKKENIELTTAGTSPYFIRFKANGVQKNYSIPMTQKSYHDSLTLNGNKVHWFEVAAANNVIETIDIGVYSDSFVVSNTYNEKDLLFSYQPKVMIAYQVPGNMGYISCGIYYLPIFPKYNRNCTVSITELTKTTVKGIFSGTLYQLDNTTGQPSLKDSVQITGGEIYMAVK